jgi:hypothetical protein
VLGQYAYLAAGGLAIVDVGDKAHPMQVGGCDTTWTSIGLELRGDYALLVGEGGLDTIDIRDPARPVRVGGFAAGKYIYGFALSGNFACLAAGNQGMDILDITDPIHPVLVGTYPGLSAAHAMQIVGNTAYVVDGLAGLVLLDVSNPALPTRLGSYKPANNNAFAVKVVDGFAYLSVWNSGLQIIDVSFPPNPVPVSALSAGNVVAARVDGGRAYIADSAEHLVVADVSDPSHPSVLGSCAITGGVAGLEIVGGYAFVAAAGGGLALVDIDLPTAPLVTKELPSIAGNSVAVRMSNGRAYLADAVSGLLVVDLVGPQHPAFVTNLATAGSVKSLAVAGTHLYLAEDVAGMEIVDIVQPGVPVVSGRHFPTLTPIRALDVEGNFAYTVGPNGLQVISVANPASPVLMSGPSGPNGLQVISVANPASPVLMSGPSGNTSFQAVDAKGSYAYFATAAFGVQVFDVGNASKPVRVGLSEKGPLMTDIRVVGGMAYVAAGRTGLIMVDVTNPANPMTVGVRSDIVADSLRVIGDTAYVLDHSGFLRAVSVADPAHPEILASYVVGMSATDFDIVGNLACISVGPRGVQLIEIDFTPVPEKPSVTAFGHYGVTTQSATIGATINPHGLPSTAVVQFGATTNLGSEIPLALLPADGTNGQVVAVSLNGLLSGVSYFYRVVAANSEGTTTTATRSFATLPILPEVTALPVTNLTSASVEIAALVKFSGNVSVRLTGPSAAASGNIFDFQLVSTNGPVSQRVSATLTGLKPGNIYNFSASASNSVGKVNSSVVTFVTPVVNTLSVTALGQWNDAPKMARSGASSVKVVGDYAYLAGAFGLEVINVHDPAHPFRAAALEFDPIYNNLSVSSMVIRGNDAFIVNNEGFYIVDIHDPTALVLVGANEHPAVRTSVAVTGNYAFVAIQGYGIEVLDFSKRASPKFSRSIGPIANGLDQVGDIMYVTAGTAGLQIADISPAPFPNVLANFRTWNSGYRVRVVNQVAYVIDRIGGLAIVDVSTPAAPKAIGAFSISWLAEGIDVAGDYAFVADSTLGLMAIDLRNPVLPVVAGLYPTTGYTVGVQVVGNLIYVADGSAGLRIMRLNLPQELEKPSVAVLPPDSQAFGSLTLHGMVNPSGSPTQAAFQTGLTTNYSNFYPLQLAAPDGTNKQPVAVTFDALLPGSVFHYRLVATNGVGTTASGDFTVTIPSVVPAVFGTEVVNASTNGATVVARIGAGGAPTSAIFQVQGPGSPIWTTLAGTSAFTGSGVVSISADLAGLTAGSTYRLRAVAANVNGSTVGAETIFSTVAPQSFYLARPGAQLGGAGGTVNGIEVNGGLAYLAAQSKGLVSVNVAEATHPMPIGSFATLGNATSVRVDGHVAYVAEGSAGLQIVDVADPSHLFLLGGWDTPGSANGVEVVGNLAYIADGAAGLQIVDISAPTVPSRMGGYDSPGNSYSVQVVGQYAYLADGPAGFQIVNITEPTHPVSTGSYLPVSGYVYQARVVGNVAFLANGGAGLEIVDVSNPSAPAKLGSYATRGVAYGVAVKDGFAYVAAGTVGLVVVDVRDPAHPVLADRYSSSGSCNAIEVVGDFAYLGKGADGLEILRIHLPPTTPVPTILGYGIVSVAPQEFELTATVSPNGLPTSGKVRFGTAASRGSERAFDFAGTDWTTNQVVRTVLSGLLPGTTYHGSIVVTNSAGTSSTGDFAFRTAMVPSLSVVPGTNGLMLVIGGEPFTRHALQHAVNLQPPVLWQTSRTFIEDARGSAAIGLEYGGSTDFWRTVPLE